MTGGSDERERERETLRTSLQYDCLQLGVCMCVCLRVCVRERERQRERELSDNSVSHQQSMASSMKQLHAVAIPLPGQGHINPLMRFCKRLASQEGFTITFVDIVPFVKSEELISKQVHESIHANTGELSEEENESTHATTSASKQELTSIDASTSPASVAVAAAEAAEAQEKPDIRRTRIPMELPKTAEGSSIIESFFGALQSLAPRIEELLSKLIHEDPPITCLISDLFMTGPTQRVADKFNIPRIAFHTSSQSVLLFTNYVHEGTISLEEVLKGIGRKKALKEETFVERPAGLPTLRNRDILDYNEDNIFMYEFKSQTLEETKRMARAFVVNSFVELEGPALKVNIGLPTYGVGPLLEPLENDTSTSFWKEDKDCMLWLNEQPLLSVLYVSFGSFASLSKAQFEEIVVGLISSQQRFLWVFRANIVKDADYLTFPIELLSKSHGRGYSIKWAPQLSVLSHPSVGGFLTHCGWNSTIEAISLGVPMLCFPYMADQYMNAKFIIEEWKVGLGFKSYKESGLVMRDEVERVIRTLMLGEEGKMLQRNANYFKEASYQNLLPEGTSSKNIKALVNSLR